ncbi:MAG: hypothetical protein V1779_12540 [bacterium]
MKDRKTERLKDRRTNSSFKLYKLYELYKLDKLTLNSQLITLNLRRCFLLILLVVVSSNFIKAQTTEDTRPFIFYPKAYNSWNFEMTAGLSLTKLPMNIVEEEINQSPMPEFHLRLGLPASLSLTSELKSNYIANYGSLGLQWTFWDKAVDIAVGAKFNAWFGHLDIESIKLKAEGMILSPYIALGLDFKDFLLSLQFETQTNRMWTQIDEKEIARKDHKIAGVALNINVEQPLWHNHYVVLGVKLNYAKFFYQSWLSYSTIDEYLLYPEFKFGFVL